MAERDGDKNDARDAAAKLAAHLGETPEIVMRRTLENIANMSPLWTASAQEIAKSGLAAADHLRAFVPSAKLLPPCSCGFPAMPCSGKSTDCTAKVNR